MAAPAGTARGQKIGRCRCGKTIEAKPVSGQTCRIEPADGLALSCRRKEKPRPCQNLGISLQFTDGRMIGRPNQSEPRHAASVDLATSAEGITPVHIHGVMETRRILAQAPGRPHARSGHRRCRSWISGIASVCQVGDGWRVAFNSPGHDRRYMIPIAVRSAGRGRSCIGGIEPADRQGDGGRHQRHGDGLHARIERPGAQLHPARLAVPGGHERHAASRSSEAAGLPGVEIVDRPLRMGSRLKDGALVTGKDFQPRLQVSRVVGTRFELRHDAEIGADEG